MTKTQFRVLYHEFVFRIVDLEMLSARADIAKLLGQFGALLAALSLMFAGGALRLLNSDTSAPALLISAWADEHFLIATTMAVVGLFAVLGWDSTFPNRRDVLVLAPLPVRARTLFLAKIAASATALGLTVLAVNVFSGLSYPLALGSIQGGVLGVLRSFAAYWITMLAAGTFMFCSILSVQGLAVQLLPHRRFLRLSAFLQLAAFCLVLTVYFLQPSLATPNGLSAPENQRLLAWLPSYWFLGLFQRLNGSMHWTLGSLDLRALTGLVVAGSVAAVTFLLSYFRALRKMIEEPDIVPGSRGTSWSPRFGDSVQSAVVLFSARALLRSRQHPVILAWYLGIGFAISLAYGRSLLYGLYGYEGYPWYEVNRPLLVVSIVMMCFAVVGMRVVFSLPLELPANWIFRTTAVHATPEYLAATRRSLFVLAIAPAWVTSAVLLFSIWPPWPVAGHLLLLGLLGLILADLCLYSFRKIPFTCSYLPGKANVHVTSGACVLVLLVLTDLGVQLELYALESLVRYIPILAVLVVTAALLRWRTTELATSPDVALQFEEAPPAQILALGLYRDGMLALTSSSPAASPSTSGDQSEPEHGSRGFVPEGTGFLRWTLRIVTALVGLCACLLLVGTGYQKIAGRLDLSAYPRPGRMIDVGGHRLHLHCTGQGSPTVVLESGLGSSMMAWNRVQRDVSQWTRVCSYDRAGYGWSDAGPQPRTSSRIAYELRVLLREAGIQGPLVLVGHSIGGVHVQFFATAYPNEVAAVVLVDSTHEDTFEELAESAPVSAWLAKRAQLVVQSLRVAGINRLLPQPADPTERAFANSNKQLSALSDEEAGTAESLAELKATPMSLGDRPLIVLTSGQNNQMEMWRRLQADLLTRSTRSKQIVAEGSGHAIHRAQPEVVVAAIHEVVEATRQ